MTNRNNRKRLSNGVSRRTMLRLSSTASIIGTGSLSLLGSAGASVNHNESEWVGVTYNPATHQEYDSSVAHLRTNNGLFEGTLQAAGYDIPIRSTDAVAIETGERPEIDYTINDQQYTKDDLPLKVKFKYYDHGVTGYVSRPNPRYVKVAFTLGSRKEGLTTDAIRSGLSTDINFMPTDPIKSLPDSGIPTRTGPDDQKNATKDESEICDDVSREITASNCSGTSRGDHGSYELSEGYHSVDDYHEECEIHFVTNSHIDHTVNPVDAPSESYDEIHGSYKGYFLNSWFSSTPDPLIWNTCDPDDDPLYDSYLDSVEYIIRHHQDYDDTQWSFADPRPDGDGNYENWVVESLLEIVDGASNHPIVAGGSAAVKAYLAGYNPVDFDDGYYSDDPNREQWWWDINTVDALPTGGCDSTGIYYRIEPGVNSLSNARNYTWVRYNYYLAKHVNHTCTCNNFGFYLHTTDWLQNLYEFDIVS
ncbi:hypothetical protein [Natrialba chahannaoensis]|uniref:hypothetical protein n=1 Tax=Natrialba chahannaoensis TaxID=68911 RepID=UPI000A957CE5|nr:hypothetical protein [Natrialba chahannaoensis]